MELKVLQLGKFHPIKGGGREGDDGFRERVIRWQCLL